jgi:hypothetical protein
LLAEEPGNTSRAGYDLDAVLSIFDRSRFPAEVLEVWRNVIPALEHEGIRNLWARLYHLTNADRAELVSWLARRIDEAKGQGTPGRRGR